MELVGEIDIANKLITGGILGGVGFIAGSYLECLSQGDGSANCLINKVGSNIVDDAENLWLNYTPFGQVVKNTVIKNDYKSVIGTIPPLKCDNSQIEFQSLCYNKSEIPQGYEPSSLGRFTKPCNKGQRDDGITCWNDIKGRGVGYPWKFGDTPFDLSQAATRCGLETGNTCELYGAIYYPKCQNLYGYDWTNDGCCLCKNINGTSYTKETAWVSPKPMTSRCPADRVNHDGLCYYEKDIAKDGYSYSSPGFYSRPKPDDPNQKPKGYLPEILGLGGLVLGVIIG